MVVVDGILEKDNKKYVVQCKRQKASVGEPALRDICGTIMHNKAAGGIFVTPSSFTSSARKFIHGKNITLYDRKETIDLLKSLIA